MENNYLLIIVLNKEEYEDDISSALIEVGITDATIIDSEGLRQVLAKGIPIFAGFKFGLEGSRPYNKVILGITDDSNIIEELTVILKDSDIDFSEPGIGRMMIIKLESLAGNPPEIYE